jgi:hypothetical protein
MPLGIQGGKEYRIQNSEVKEEKEEDEEFR